MEIFKQLRCPCQ